MRGSDLRAHDHGEQRLEAGVEQLAWLVPTDHREPLDAAIGSPMQRKSSPSGALYSPRQPASDGQRRAIGLNNRIG